MYKIKNKIAAACGFEAPCNVALIYQCDGENVADGGEQLYMLNITLQCSKDDKYYSVSADTYIDDLTNVVGSILGGLENYCGHSHESNTTLDWVDCDDDAPAVYKVLCEQLAALYDCNQLPNGVGRYFEAAQ